MRKKFVLLGGLLTLGVGTAQAVEVAHVYEGGQVLIYEGSKAGLKEGQVLSIERAGKIVGQIQIDEVSSFTAKGRTLDGAVDAGDKIATAGSGITETPSPFATAGKVAMPSAHDPTESRISTGGMKRIDEPEPAIRRYSLEDTDSSGSEVIEAKPLDGPAPGALDKPTTVAMMGGAIGALNGSDIPKSEEKKSTPTGSLGLVTRPTAVVFKKGGGLVGAKMGWAKDSGTTRKTYFGRFAPTDKMEIFVESTTWDIDQDNITRYGGKYAVKTMKNGSQIALYGNMDSGDVSASEYGVVGSFGNGLTGRFSLGSYLSQGGAEGLVNGRKARLGEDYGFFLGYERNLVMGLSVALEYDTMASIEGAGYGAELRWKRGSNYSLTASVNNVDGFSDGTLGMFFSF